MKILYLTYSNQSGVVDMLSYHLSKNGFQVDIVNIAKNYFYRYDKVKIPRISLFNLMNIIAANKQFGSKWKTGYQRTDFAYKIMSNRATKVIQNHKDYHAIFQSGVLFTPAINTVSKPYFLGILDNTYLIGRKGRRRPVGLGLSERFIQSEKATYKLADKIFVMSQHVKNSLIKDYQIAPKKIIVTGVGPNIEPGEDFIPSSEKYNSKKILMIGLNFKDKGGFELLKAFEIVRRKHPQSKLVVVGDKAGIKQEGVIFKGVLGKAEVKKELAEASIFIFPSRKDAFGIVLIEAMAFSTPCIGMDIEAVPEIITANETGFVLRSGDIKGLAIKIDILLNKPELAKEFGQKGFEKYNRQYKWSIIIQKVIKELG